MKMFIFFFPLIAFAEGGSFPGAEIFFQAFNFTGFLALLIFFLRNPIKKHFKQRQEDFLLFKAEAENKEKEQVQQLNLLKKKMDELKQKEKTIEAEARKQGEVFISEKRKEFENLKQNKQKEMKFVLDLEQGKMQQILFAKWKTDIWAKAKAKLEKEASDPTLHKNMHQDFVKQLEELV